jgi:hypothetical protein
VKSLAKGRVIRPFDLLKLNGVRNMLTTKEVALNNAGAMNVKKPVIAAIFGFLCLCLIAAAMASSARENAADFNQDMRKLWEDHITWTRLYIVNTLAGLPAQAATAKRLLANQTDIGDAFKPFYGEVAGDRLTELLKEHVLIAAEVIDAAKAGKHSKQEDAAERWYANSDDIAVFLSGVNPKNWPFNEMKPMLREHLDTTTKEVAAGLKKDWTADIAAYDELHKQILEMADMLSSGIIKQFPDKFKK